MEELESCLQVRWTRQTQGLLIGSRSQHCTASMTMEAIASCASYRPLARTRRLQVCLPWRHFRHSLSDTPVQSLLKCAARAECQETGEAVPAWPDRHLHAGLRPEGQGQAALSGMLAACCCAHPPCHLCVQHLTVSLTCRLHTVASLVMNCCRRNSSTRLSEQSSFTEGQSTTRTTCAG